MFSQRSFSFPLLSASVLFLLTAQGAIGTSISRRVIRIDNSEKNLIGQGSKFEQAKESEAGIKPESEKLRSAISGIVDSQNPESVQVENPASDRNPRTLFHHVANTINKAEFDLTKLLSLIFKHTSGPAYRKETSNNPGIQAPGFLRPLANIPHFLTTHPINFKKLLPSLQHNVGKRSVEQEQGGGQFPTPSVENPDQGRTLHRIIPNFEANFNRLFQPFRSIFPTNNAQQQQPQYQNDIDNTYEETSKSPAVTYPYIRQGNGPIGFTNLMRMLPEIFNRRNAANQGQQPHDLISGGLQRIMAMLRRPLFPASSQSQKHYSS